MGFFSQRVDRSEIVAGDHIYTYRNGYAFSHHGIYVGKNVVVHFGPGQLSGSVSGIQSGSFNSSTCSKDFPDCGYRKPKSGLPFWGIALPWYKYGCRALATIVKRGGTSTTAKSDAPELAISRAMHLLHNGFGDYNFLFNNCEDFGLYCKTGLRTRNQRFTLGSGQVTSFTCIPEVVFESCCLMAVPSCVGIASAVLAPIGTVIGAGLYGLSRVSSDIGVRRDVARVEVAGLVPFRRSKAAKEQTKSSGNIKVVRCCKITEL